MHGMQLQIALQAAYNFYCRLVGEAFGQVRCRDGQTCVQKCSKDIYTYIYIHTYIIDVFSNRAYPGHKAAVALVVVAIAANDTAQSQQSVSVAVTEGENKKCTVRQDTSSGVANSSTQESA